MRPIVLAAVAALAGCSPSATEPAADSAATTDALQNVELEAAPPANAPAPRTVVGRTAATKAVAVPIVTAPLLAYRYTFQLQLPARAIRPLLTRHEAACVAAGATVCQIVALTSSSEGRDRIGAELELRARPDWLGRFRAGLEGQATQAGGRVAGSGTQTEDLTRSIIDTEALLRAKSTLRDRLIRLLAERPGKLEEVLQVEQELARVQGEIDAGLSSLAVMRTRVDTSTLAIRYASEGAPVQDGVFAPLSDAGNGFVRNLVAGFAAILTLTSWLLPFALLLAAAGWAALTVRRRYRAPRRTPPPPQPLD